MLKAPMAITNFGLMFLIATIVIPFAGVSQPGCTDPNASNYNASATVNNGSCLYNPTVYVPPFKFEVNSTLNETSGLLYANGFLWTFNDRGGEPAIYRIDTISNTILQKVTLGGTTNIDWEDIAFDGTNVYIGDFGNNFTGARTDLKIYRFPLSEIPDYTSNATFTIPSTSVETINFTYADQPQPPVNLGIFNIKFDCGAMFIDEGKIHLFTKNFVDLNTTHYEINSTMQGTYVAANIETFKTDYFVTAVDKVPGKKLIVLLGYIFPNPSAFQFGNHFMTILSDYTGSNYFSGNKRTLNLPDGLQMGQAEGIVFKSETYGYISNEAVSVSGFSVPAQLRSFNIASFIPPSVLALNIINFNAIKQSGIDKLSWNFASQVQQLELQTSLNGRNFIPLKFFGNAQTGRFEQQTTNPINYYRLSWKNDENNVQYSRVVTTRATGNNNVVKPYLTNQGTLVFELNGGQPTTLAFSIISTDGKLLAARPLQTYQPGVNRIEFAKYLPGKMVLLSATTANGYQGQLLPVNR